MLIFTSHNLNHCFQSRGTRSLWNVFEVVQNTRSTCFIGFKNTAALVLNSTSSLPCCDDFVLLPSLSRFSGFLLLCLLLWRGVLGFWKINIPRVPNSWKQVEPFSNCTPFEVINSNVVLKNSHQLRCGNLLCMHCVSNVNVVSNHCKALGLATLRYTVPHGPH